MGLDGVGKYSMTVSLSLTILNVMDLGGLLFRF